MEQWNALHFMQCTENELIYRCSRVLLLLLLLLPLIERYVFAFNFHYFSRFIICKMISVSAQKIIATQFIALRNKINLSYLLEMVDLLRCVSEERVSFRFQELLELLELLNP